MREKKCTFCDFVFKSLPFFYFQEYTKQHNQSKIPNYPSMGQESFMNTGTRDY